MLRRVPAGSVGQGGGGEATVQFGTRVRDHEVTYSDTCPCPLHMRFQNLSFTLLGSELDIYCMSNIFKNAVRVSNVRLEIEI